MSDQTSLTAVTDPLLIQAEEHIHKGELAVAARILVDLVEKDDKNWRAYCDIGIIAWMQEAWEDAFTMFKKSASINPVYTDALVNLFDAALKLRRIPEVTHIFQLAQLQLPESDEIALIVKSILDQGEHIYLSPRAQAVGLYNPLIKQAHKELDEGKLNEAMTTYLKAHDEEGPNSEIYSGLGIISFYQKRFSDATSLFTESIKLCPYDPDAYLNLLDAAKECGKIDDAKKLYETYKNEVPALADIAEHFQ